ncbi:protease B nonderepressible form [Coniosporium tulheliwenetii]|uniref:Protease B nonderepressible form n=1 Tax=Coniosporium tulheliwenetii TaxID=3383036 RepID=A0ACC2Z6K6_9PEZI|nr:protease B nonderepressible form [Cladosporium sp. JES 115]
MDIDYDAISHALVINAFWNEAPGGGSWHDRIERTRDDETIEVGVLSNETPEEPEELKLGGFLIVVGEDDTPSTPLTPPSKARCSLHTYLTLPSALFIDKYAFSDALTLQSLNLAALRTVYGETDLEAPDWVIPRFGSAALFELATLSPASPSPAENTAAEDNGSWTVEIPLHLRYLPPTAGGYTDLAVPWPVVFWACTANEGTRMAVNPFDRVNLGYDGLFGDRTMFYHVPPSPSGNGTEGGRSRLVETLQVPVLDLKQACGNGVGVLEAVEGWVEGRRVEVVSREQERKKQ